MNRPRSFRAWLMVTVSARALTGCGIPWQSPPIETPTDES